MPSQLLLALAVGALLSVLGLPEVPFARRGRGAAVPLGTRWALFRWFHPILASALRWAAASAAAALAAWASWPWIGGLDIWSVLGDGAARMFHPS